MKFKIFLICIFGSILFSQAQSTYTIEKLNLKFDSDIRLVSYDRHMENAVAYQDATENLIIDINRVPLSKQKERYSKDAKEATVLLAKSLNLEDVSEAMNLTNQPNGYYVKARDNRPSASADVFVIYILSEATRSSYEITVYCYKNNQKAAENIAKSFSITN